MGDNLNYSLFKNRNVILAILFALFCAGFSFAQENSNSVDTESISISSDQVSSVDESSIFLGGETATGDAEDQVTVNETGSLGRSIWIFVRMILVLAFVVFLIWLVFKYIKKTNPTLGEKDKYLRKVAGISVGPGKTVQIISLLDKAYMIGVSDDSINLIAEIDDKELVGAMNLDADMKEGSSKPMNFQDLLNSVIPSRKNESSGNGEGSAYGDSSSTIVDMLGNQSKRLK